MSHASTPVRISKAEVLLLNGSCVVVLVLMLLPIAAVILMSFTDAASLQFPPAGLSTRWYAATWDLLFGPDADIIRLREAVSTSVEVAAFTAGICVLAGVPAAYALARFDFPGRSIVDSLVDLPIVFPAIVLAISLLLVVSALPFEVGITQLVIAHSIVTLPFMVRNVAAALGGVDPSLQEAAGTLGASPMRAFIEIVYPLIRSGIASGISLVFVLSFNEFTLTYFLSTVDAFPLSMWLFQQSNTTLDPTTFAISTVIIAINTAVIVAIDRLAGQRRS